MTRKTFEANGKTIKTEDVNFINIVYIDDKTMDVTVHLADSTTEKFISTDEPLFEELDKYCDICSEK